MQAIQRHANHTVKADSVARVDRTHLCQQYSSEGVRDGGVDANEIEDELVLVAALGLDGLDI